MSRWSIPWLSLIGLVAASPAWSDDAADCNDIDNPDRVISGCSNIISTGLKSGAELAGIYANRGLAYWSKGNYDSAITDLTKVIELNPRDAAAYANRGLAYGRK